QLHIVDLATEKEVATFPLERAWSGLAWMPNGKRVLISGGQNNDAADIYSFQRWDDGSWTRKTLQLTGAVKAKTAISSIVVSPDGGVIYAINDLDGFLYMLDAGGHSVAKLSLGDRPFSAKLSRDGKLLYVSNIATAEVVVVDVSHPSDPSLTDRIPVEPHPNDLAVTADGRLFVSCGNTNHVVVIDLKTKKAME